jgi:hypothetical protein
MGNSVSINGPGTVTGQFNYTAPDGSVTTFYGWTFSVTVNGQVGVYTVWIDSNTDENAAENDAIDDLQNDPGALGGISENDPTSDPGGPDGDPDDDDGVLADGGNGDGDESSV